MATKRKREYGSEALAAPLIAWLNEARGTAQASGSYRRLTKLRELLLEASGLAAIYRAANSRAREHPEFVERTEKLREQINVVLHYYKLQPAFLELRLSQHRWFLKWSCLEKKSFSATIAESIPNLGGYRFGEADALMRVLDLGQGEYLAHVRPCQQCQQWFYAIRVGRYGQFHNRECQQKYFRSRPGFREQRRLWMREHRRLLADRDQKSLTIARRRLKTV